ncbi:hypothetical protein NLI96_g8311 [Meripilus lineatus]|uniref:F-box domain-containing protein n=1 Tax=Meripilus lineatus TaxID=2056292 RepID=A0AAD5UXU4_9APHY|nr:hypothetical protein NLI96_g8311 [Physisporinus lineatus]
MVRQGAGGRERGLLKILDAESLAKLRMSPKEIEEILSKGNERTPISRISDDTLLRILLFAVTTRDTMQSRWSRWRKKDRTPEPGWPIFTICRVCKKWKDIAEHNALIWTEIDSDDLVDALLSIGMSRGAPLRFNFGPIVSDQHDHKSDLLHMFVDIMEGKRERIRGLNVDLSNDLLSDVMPLLSFGMPILQELALCRRRFAPKKPILPITTGIVMEHHPTLRHLSLDGLIVPFQSPIFQGLRSLELRNLYTSFTKPADVPPITELLDVLKQCPQLERLVLESAGPKFTEQVKECPKPTRQVDLPHLAFLKVENAAMETANTLSHLIVPESCHAEINSTVLFRHTKAFLTFLPVDRSNLKMLGAIDEVDITFFWHPNFGFCVNMTGLQRSKITTKLQAQWCHTVKHKIKYQERIPQVMDSATQVFPNWAALQRVSLCLYFKEITLSLWKVLFEAIPSVTYLKLTNRELNEGEWSESELPLLGLHPTEEQVLCPDLDTLVFDHFSLETTWKTVVENCFKKRFERGSRLNKLVLDRYAWLGSGKLTFPAKTFGKICGKVEML